MKSDSSWEGGVYSALICSVVLNLKMKICGLVLNSSSTLISGESQSE